MNFKQRLMNMERRHPPKAGVLASVGTRMSINGHEHGAENQSLERITLIPALTFVTPRVCFCWGLAVEETETTLGRLVSKAAFGFAREFWAGTFDRQRFLGSEIQETACFSLEVCVGFISGAHKTPWLKMCG